MPISETLTIDAVDGFPLSTTLIKPDNDTPKAAVLMFPATGIKRHYYLPFSEWLAEQGYVVLATDFRGIGESRNGKHIREFTDGLQAWGELDMPAIVDWMSAQYPELKLNLVGNSAGGQMVGLLPNHGKIDKVVSVAGSSGYVKKIKMPLWVVSNTLFRYCMPLLIKMKGYAPMNTFGMGQDLPPQMGLDWSRWCSSKGYLSTDFGTKIKQHWFDQTTMPIHWLSATDDPIATEHNVKDMARLSPAKNNTFQRVKPSELGYKSIGHITMFGRNKDKFWPLIETQLLS